MYVLLNGEEQLVRVDRFDQVVGNLVSDCLVHNAFLFAFSNHDDRYVRVDVYKRQIDSNDNLWVAQWGGFGVYCYNPYTGELLGKVEVPAPNVASCAFGGKDMDTLYITTARAGLSEQQLEEYPLSGSLFVCRCV